MDWNFVKMENLNLAKMEELNLMEIFKQRQLLHPSPQAGVKPLS